VKCLPALGENALGPLDAVPFKHPVHEIEEADRQHRVVQVAFSPAGGEYRVHMSLRGLGRRQRQHTGEFQYRLELRFDRRVADVVEQGLNERFRNAEGAGCPGVHAIAVLARVQAREIRCDQFLLLRRELRIDPQHGALELDQCAAGSRVQLEDVADTGLVRQRRKKGHCELRLVALSVE
jgi:hypothetical protein